MAKFKVQVPHQLTREQASERLKAHSEQARAQMPREVSDVVEVWDDKGNLDFSFKALGFAVSGQMVSEQTTVTVTGKLPFAALPFRGMIEAQLVERIQSALG